MAGIKQYLAGKKTYLLALSGLLALLAAWATGTESNASMLHDLFGILALMTGRAAIQKAEVAAKPDGENQ